MSDIFIVNYWWIKKLIYSMRLFFHISCEFSSSIYWDSDNWVDDTFSIIFPLQKTVQVCQDLIRLNCLSYKMRRMFLAEEWHFVTNENLVEVNLLEKSKFCYPYRPSQQLWCSSRLTNFIPDNLKWDVLIKKEKYIKI